MKDFPCRARPQTATTAMGPGRERSMAMASAPRMNWPRRSSYWMKGRGWAPVRGVVAGVGGVGGALGRRPSILAVEVVVCGEEGREGGDVEEQVVEEL